MSATSISASCHCGAVSLQLRAEPSFEFVCQCENCRKLNGGMLLAGATFAREAMTVSGKPSVYRYAGGKAEIELNFCGACGTPVFALPAHYPDVAVVRANTLDHGHSFAPRKSIFTDGGCAWMQFVGA